MTDNDDCVTRGKLDGSSRTQPETKRGSLSSQGKTVTLAEQAFLYKNAFSAWC